jgi:signal transduction histidine kinase
MAALGLAIVAAGGVYLLLGGRIDQVARLSNIPAMLTAAIVTEFLNAILVIGAVSLQIKLSPWKVWRQNVSWAVPINILGMLLGGAGLAIGYEIAGLLGLGVFALPILLTIYAFRLYVEQTKAQMDRLEEIITERTAELQKTTEELQETNVELQRLDQVKTSFFSMINHEMRNPVAAVIGYLDILDFGGSLNSDQEEAVGHIKKNSLTLLELVNNILDVSRIEDGRLNIIPQPMQLQPVIDDAVAVIMPRADSKKINIELDLAAELPTAHGDPIRVRQILVNLLSNAVKYTPNEGQVKLSVLPSHQVGLIEIHVADTGYGIPADALPTIFERFNRAERPEIKSIEGTGLGLAITKGLVEAHGGEILVESVVNEGSCFRFTLPIVDSLQAEENQL